MKVILGLLLGFFIQSALAKSNYGIEKNSPEKILHEAIDRAAIKYYGFAMASVLNNILFEGRLSVNEERQLDKVMLNHGSRRFIRFSKMINKKYKSVIKKIDESYEDEGDLSFKIYTEIDKLYNLKEVQQEVIQKIFSPERKRIVSEYIELVRKEEINEVSRYILNQWGGRENFIDLVNRTELFWPDMNELEDSFVETKINGVKAYSLSDDDNKNDKIPEWYDGYVSAGVSFYVSINAAMRASNEKYTNPQLLIFPSLFFGVNELGTSTKKDELDFALIGTLAHEFGHVIAYFSSEQVRQNFNKISIKEVAEIENDIFLPFVQCYMGDKLGADIGIVRDQIGESRADAISYIVQNSLVKKFGIKDWSVYHQMLNTFKKSIDEKVRVDDDAHPLFEDRRKVSTGKCQMRQIPPYFRYTDDGLDRGESL